MLWKLIEEGPKSASENMQKDADLLATLELPTLHLYEWDSDAATFGHFINPADYLDLEKAALVGLHLAKRPTGGGIIFHICDLAFSVLIPATHPNFSDNTLENYAFVNQRVIAAIQLYLKCSTTIELLPNEPIALDRNCRAFCMAKPTKYDVMIEGKKIGGAAQRKTKKGFLHQGSISVAKLSEDYLKSLLLPNTYVLEGMRHHSHALIEGEWTKQSLKYCRDQMRHHLKEVFINN